MSHVMRASDLIGLPVVSIASGEDVAEVRDVVYDAHGHRLVGFTLNKRGRLSGPLKQVLAADALAAVGADAVMIADEGAITESRDGPAALQDPGAAASVVGNRVLSADGNELGTVTGVVVLTGRRPEAVGYEVNPGDGAASVFVPISEQMALSGENLLLPAQATDFVRHDLAGFGGSVASFRAETLQGEDR